MCVYLQAGKEYTCNTGGSGHAGSIPEFRGSCLPHTHMPLGRGYGNPLQYSCLVNPMDRGALWATVYGVAKNQTCLK